MSNYAQFLERKLIDGSMTGFDPVWMPDWLYDFQQSLVEWALRKGKSAIFADCGLGKTPMQLVVAENVVRKTNGRALILSPLGVAHQTVTEAEKFGIEARRSLDGKLAGKIIVANYERLHLFNADDFEAVILDESSILKNFEGQRKKQITDFMKKRPYRFLFTATAAPNDYTELGTSSEVLGALAFRDMLDRFFKNDQNNIEMKTKWVVCGGTKPKWSFRGHAEIPFWRWVCSWARAARKPSDLGFDDTRYVLPELIEREHILDTTKAPDGMLFALPAIGMREQREEARRMIYERCEKLAELMDTGASALSYCHLNPEGDLLEKLVTGGVQVSGKDDDDEKEEKFRAFTAGEIRVLITKPKIGALGLNFQHCNHVTFFTSHSFEQYYQGVRRCWRFGQKRPVTVDIVASEGERGVMANLQRKAHQAERMFENLVNEMNRAQRVERARGNTRKEVLPAWL